MSQLFVLAKTLCDEIDSATLKSVHGMDAIVDRICRCDALSICNVVFSDFVKLMNTHRSLNKNFASFESRFLSFVTTLNLMVLLS